jgi:hypothetical protein
MEIDVVSLVESLSFIKDVRRPPDERRKARFRAGWEDATVRRKEYSSQTLRNLTWHNLGYRTGKILGSLTVFEINRIFDSFAKLYNNIEYANNIANKDLEGRLYIEGSVYKSVSTTYERSKGARKACIARYGTSCYVCGFDFGITYGSVAAGYIHVHHLNPISQCQQEYQIAPVNDLRPVCPNCHAVIHMRCPPYSIEEVRSMLDEMRKDTQV